MNREDAEKTVTEYLKPIFGFALKRCRSAEDAEDLSQEIVLKAYRTLLSRDDIRNTDKFIWTLAHNALANYYRDTAKITVGIPLDGLEEMIADTSVENLDNADAVNKLRYEIAYLSKTRRRILVAYYFENKRQADIARELNIPVGTVKWHLFEAKKDLKRGMEKMRETSNLKFNPVTFDKLWFSGSIGENSSMEMLKPKLIQNICYCVRDTAKTVEEIADDLGVSPVYIEDEVEKLEKMLYLTEKNGKYLTNFIIQEKTPELCEFEMKMNAEMSELCADALYEELMLSGLLDSESIKCTFDKNYLLWSVLPYILAMCGEGDFVEKIKFYDVSSIRPDGSNNIVYTSVDSNNIIDKTSYKMNGPMHGKNDSGDEFWKINTKFDERPDTYLDVFEAIKVLSLYKRNRTENLSCDEYAYLAENGYVIMNDDGTARWLPVILYGEDIKEKLFSLGRNVKKKYSEKMEELKKSYFEETLKNVSEHTKHQMEFLLQFTFECDGAFLYSCICHLVNSGKLTLPTEEEKKSLMTILIIK